MKAFINLAPGAVVEYDGVRYVITSVLTLETVLAKNEETGTHRELPLKDITPISDLTPVEDAKQTDLSLIPEDDWNKASGWAARLSRLASAPRRTTEMVDEVARDMGASRVTVYRKLKVFEIFGKVSSLITKKSTGGKGKSRLTPEVDAIIRSTVNELRFTSGKKKRSIEEIHEEIQRKLNNTEFEAPGIGTIQRRIHSIQKEKDDEQQSSRQDNGQRNVAYPGRFPGADFPLSVVQIDHTKLDVILVDDADGETIGRPWITLAIDVFSRTVPGYYVSLDPPGNISVGLCIAHAILPKDKWLSKHNIDIPWPTCGVMNKIHADNAGEFRGDMLKRACQEYSIDLEWRPVKKPRYGAHIESLIGTFAEKIHQLNGTTFSNPKERGNYDSDKHADMTITDFEEWLAKYIAGVYHQQLHSALHTSPIKQYEKGILGTKDLPGRGIPLQIRDEDRLRLDLLPAVERTIQEYGVVIDYIHYYSGVLNKYVNQTERNSNRKRSFIFKRDPRRINPIYFFDPEIKEYFRVPYRDTSQPTVSIWEYRRARRRLEEQGVEDVDEGLIFRTLKEMRAIEERATRENKSRRREAQRRRAHQQIEEPKTADDRSRKPEQTVKPDETEDTPIIEPFDEMEF
jgi:putative transposase